MGREIRRVPANWEHPKYRIEQFRNRVLQWVYTWHPLFDRDFAKELAEWKEAKAAWDRGERDESAVKYGCKTFEEWHGDAPNREWYVPYDVNGDLPWWQMYETVSEGTPVTPAFATPEELIDFLVSTGEVYDSGESDGPWPRDRAEKFVRSEQWFPSMITVGGETFTAKDGFPK